jgi:hypothetical protein
MSYSISLVFLFNSVGYEMLRQSLCLRHLPQMTHVDTIHRLYIVYCTSHSDAYKTDTKELEEGLLAR